MYGPKRWVWFPLLYHYRVVRDKYIPQLTADVMQALKENA